MDYRTLIQFHIQKRADVTVAVQMASMGLYVFDTKTLFRILRDKQHTDFGRQVIIRHIPDRQDKERDNWMARDGIVIVPKNGLIPDGPVI